MKFSRALGMALLPACSWSLLLQDASRDTPVKRVVSLLNKMQTQLQKDMDDDDALNNKLNCWCNDNEYEKTNAIEDGQTKIADLKSSIESLTAKKAELATKIKELNDAVADNKATLAEATATRKKELQEFQGLELDDIQAIENLKAAIEVLSKHFSADKTSGYVPKTVKEAKHAMKGIATSFLAHGSKTEPWMDASSQSTRSLDEFMRQNNIFDTGNGVAQRVNRHDDRQTTHVAAGLSTDEFQLVRSALKSASALVQSRSGYYPAYTSQSGEIFGIMKQLKEELEGDHAEAQKQENQRAAAFAELRAAKESEIEMGEATAEKKEDEHATTSNQLAEAKEDLGEEEKTLEEAQTFKANLLKTCGEANTNFAQRKQVRTEEMQAVSETIAILQADNARDVATATYGAPNFVQRSSDKRSNIRGRTERGRVAASLRRAAIAAHDPKLALLATQVELDAFTKVKAAIDDMIATMKVQMEDEVKKSDYCKAELQQTAMTTAKTEEHKADLQAKEAELESTIKTLGEEIAAAHTQIAELQLNLQRANEDRKAENLEFQTTVSDQMATAAVLKTALERLAKFYEKEDEEALLQVKGRQTPPVVQAKYAPNKGSAGVMQMIEKLIQEAHAMIADSRKAESDAQAAYEQIIADTNGSVAALQKEVVSKTKAKAEATKEKQQTGQDIIDRVNELEGLAKYTAELHSDCDFVLKNFDVRQKARSEEIESLQQAKEVLSGASFQ